MGALIHFENRVSDSPLVERVWRCHSERGGEFASVAASHFEIAITRLRGQTICALRGPETKGTVVDCPGDGEWLGIRFKVGTFMPEFLPGRLRDLNDVTLGGASARAFWLKGSAWEYPSFDNAEEFVRRLARAGLVTRDPAIDGILDAQPLALSARSAQRRFLRSTGITHTAHSQICRFRRALQMLRDGVSIADTVYDTGYFDQAHLTRAVRRFAGMTPAKVQRRDTQVSFLYKTEPSR